jgi:signal transduction histidine kinase
MPSPLRILHLEDSPADAELVAAVLDEGGLDCRITRVDAQAAFEQALADGTDVILADYSLPSFDGAAALERARVKAPDVPFIFVTGALGEEKAVETLKSGATDYVLKHRLARLPGAVIRALRDRQRMYDQQRRVEQMAAVARLASAAAHELRNPLTSIKMLAQANLEDARAAGRPAGDWEVVEQEARRMERFLQSFLDFARPAKPQRAPTDLTAVVDSVLALTAGRARRQKVEMEFVKPGPLPVCDMDAGQIRQLLLNLVLNGLDAMPGGGRLRIEAGAGDGRVELRVIDSGAGIAPEIMPRLFEFFVSDKETGMGLGLAISRRIAEDHGGRLHAYNLPAGGACFCLELPAAGKIKG